MDETMYSRFKISSINNHFTLTLEVNADLVECVVNKNVSLLAKPRIIDIIHPSTLDFLICC